MELSTPVIIGIVLLALVVLVVLIVVGVNASKRARARQEEADRQRAAQLREEAQKQDQVVQERDLQARETELHADRARLDAERKAKEAEQEQVAAERRRAQAETQREAVDQDRGQVQARLDEADRLDPDSADDRLDQAAPGCRAETDRRHDAPAGAPLDEAADWRPVETADEPYDAPDRGEHDLPGPAGHGERGEQGVHREQSVHGEPGEPHPEDAGAQRAGHGRRAARPVEDAPFTEADRDPLTDADRDPLLGDRDPLPGEHEPSAGEDRPLPGERDPFAPEQRDPRDGREDGPFDAPQEGTPRP